MIKKLQNYSIWIVLLVAIAILYTRFSEKLYFGVGKIVVEQAGSSTDPLIVIWRGKVEPPMGERLMAAISKNNGGTDRIILKLDSPGGLTSYGSSVINRINRLKGRYIIDTHVAAGDRCLSMCVALYLQGQTRYASSGARFMFHEVSSHNMLTDEPVAMSKNERKAKTDRLYLRYFDDAKGVSPSWMRKLRRDMRGKDIWRSGQQLIEEQSGIVQKLI